MGGLFYIVRTQTRIAIVKLSLTTNHRQLVEVPAAPGGPRNIRSLDCQSDWHFCQYVPAVWPSYDRLNHSFADPMLHGSRKNDRENC